MFFCFSPINWPQTNTLTHRISSASSFNIISNCSKFCGSNHAWIWPSMTKLWKWSKRTNSPRCLERRPRHSNSFLTIGLMCKAPFSPFSWPMSSPANSTTLIAFCGANSPLTSPPFSLPILSTHFQSMFSLPANDVHSLWSFGSPCNRYKCDVHIYHFESDAQFESLFQFYRNLTDGLIVCSSWCDRCALIVGQWASNFWPKHNNRIYIILIVRSKFCVRHDVPFHSWKTRRPPFISRSFCSSTCSWWSLTFATKELGKGREHLINGRWDANL